MAVYYTSADDIVDTYPAANFKAFDTEDFEAEREYLSRDIEDLKQLICSLEGRLDEIRNCGEAIEEELEKREDAEAVA
jgi:hypothetical protein